MFSIETPDTPFFSDLRIAELSAGRLPVVIGKSLLASHQFHS